MAGEHKALCSTSSLAGAGGAGRGDARFRSQFRKTELCAFFAAGWCSKGGRCEFAHGEQELEVAPDLSKTSVCLRWLKHSCARSRTECPYAHGVHDMRKTEAYAGTSGATSSQQSREVSGSIDGRARNRVQKASGGCSETVYQQETTPPQPFADGWPPLTNAPLPPAPCPQVVKSLDVQVPQLMQVGFGNDATHTWDGQVQPFCAASPYWPVFCVWPIFIQSPEVSATGDTPTGTSPPVDWAAVLASSRWPSAVPAVAAPPGHSTQVFAQLLLNVATHMGTPTAATEDVASPVLIAKILRNAMPEVYED